MSDTKMQDSAQVPVETGGAPLPPVSQPSEGQLGSGGGIDTDALRKEITEQVKEDLKRELRAAQSEKDRTLSDYRENKAKIDELYSYFKKYPDNPDQAKREWEVDQLIRERSERTTSPANTGSVARVGLAERARDKLGTLGVTDKADQDTIMQEWASKNVPAGGYGSDDAALVGIAEFVVDHKVAKAKRDAPASAASAIAPLGGEVKQEDAGVIADKLIELQKGNLNDPANAAARAALSEKLKSLNSK